MILEEEKMKKALREIQKVLAENELTFDDAKYCLNTIILDMELMKHGLCFDRRRKE